MTLFFGFSDFMGNEHRHSFCMGKSYSLTKSM